MSSGGSARNFIPIQNKYDRIVLLVDMDCFYCQVEVKLDPTLKGKPLAVVQYNAWRGGGIIAVNYEARAKGVTRHMRGDEAKEQCPEIQLVKVPNVREKADLTKYREAGKEVANVLQRYTPLLERASVDEAYLDITDEVNKRLVDMNAGSFILPPEKLAKTYAVGYTDIGKYVTELTARLTDPYADDEAYQCAHDAMDVPSVRQSDIRLLLGASIASEIRDDVKLVTGYECSAGIAHNKILAKLACGLNKPDKQTILPLSQIPSLFETLPVGKIRGLGAKFGEEVCERLTVRFLGQLLKFTEAELQRKFDEKTGTWLYQICRGIDLEVVTPKFYSKSIGCCKKFPGRNNITGLKTLKHWLNELANEIRDRLEKDFIENNRRAKQMVVNYVQEFDGEEISSSRSGPLSCYDQETLAKNSFELIKANTKQLFRSGSEAVLNNPIKFLGISVGKFEVITSGQNKLQEMFANQVAKKRRSNEEGNIEKNNECSENECSIGKPDGDSAKAPSREEMKMKSFFANYLQIKKDSTSASVPQNTVKNEEICQKTAIEEQKKIDPEIDSERKSKSFFLNSFSKQKIKIDKEKEKPEPLPQNSTVGDAPILDLGVEVTISQEDDLKLLEGELKLIESEVPESLNKNTEIVEIIEDTNSTDATAILIVQKPSDAKAQKRKFTTLTDSRNTAASDTCALDYQANYAEFALPDLRPEFIQLSTCATCGSKIPADEISMQSHQDLHFAQQLSQQQRDEYRADIKNKIAITGKSTLNNSLKKLKKSPLATTKAVPKVPTSNITKFLRPMLMDTPSCASSQTEGSRESDEMATCSECKLPVKKSEMTEHMDFHVAKELQKKLNQLDVRTVTVMPKKPNSSRPTTSKLNNSSSVHSTSGKGSAKPITHFFSQPNFR